MWRLIRRYAYPEVTDAGAWAALKTGMVLLCRDRWHYSQTYLVCGNGYNFCCRISNATAAVAARKQLAQTAGTFLVMRNGRH
jgi:hypothetical protein